jgi:hypothetical protein
MMSRYRSNDTTRAVAKRAMAGTDRPEGGEPAGRNGLRERQQIQPERTGRQCRVLEVLPALPAPTQKVLILLARLGSAAFLLSTTLLLAGCEPQFYKRPPWNYTFFKLAQDPVFITLYTALVGVVAIELLRLLLPVTAERPSRAKRAALFLYSLLLLFLILLNYTLYRIRL